MKEHWKEICDFPGYEVSNHGRIRRISAHFRLSRDGIMGLYQVGAGYLGIQFNRDRRKHMRYVHRLVASAFVLNRQNLTEVNHKDGDKKNNIASNLEWTTRQKNNLHKNRVLKSYHNKRFYKVWRDDKTQAFIIDNLARFCSENNLTTSACTMTAQKKRSHHKGWHFEYVDSKISGGG